MSKKDKLLLSAQKNLRKGQVSKAVADYQAVVQLDPRDIRNRQKLAELLTRLRRTEDALIEYGFVAKYYAENGFYPKAIAVYKQMQKIDPSQMDLTLRMAELHGKQGLVGNAMAEYRRLVSYYEQQQMLPEAINVLQRMQELDPHNVNVRVKIAETYTKADLQDKGWETLVELFELLEGKKNHGAKKKLYDLFAKDYGDKQDFRLGYARTLIHLGEGREAIDLLTQLLEENADPATVKPYLGQAYRIAGEYDAEEALRRSLLQHTPEDLDQRALLVEALMLKACYADALSELEDWKEVFASRDRLPELKGFYETLREELSDNEQVVSTLKSIYEYTGEGEKLFDLMDQAEVPSDEAEEETLDVSAYSDPMKDLDTPSEPTEEIEEVEEIPESLVEEEAETAGPDEELELDLGFVLDVDDAESDVQPPVEKESQKDPVDVPQEEQVQEEAEDLLDIDFSDLSLDTIFEESGDAAAPPEKQPVEAKSQKSRSKGKTDIWVEEGQIDVDDAESHYNLGIAYKEMGLLDEAITEFRCAMKNPGREIDSLILQGLCLVEKGATQEAIDIFRMGLSIERASQEELANMNYELGNLLLAQGDKEAARDCFEKVQSFDAAYRDIREKMSACG